MAEAHFSKNQTVEVRSDDEGFKGSWYTATIIRLPSDSSASKWKNNALVEYLTLMDDEEGSKPLREYASLSNIRPVPPKSIDCVFDLNEEVDAFYNDGWWRGYIARILENSRYVVHFISGEEMEFGQSDIRVYLDWIDNQWVRPKEPPKQNQGATSLRFKTGSLVEVSFDNENYFGAWFPATVLEATENNSFLVEYHSLKSSGDPGLLKATVDSSHIRPFLQTLGNKSFRLLEKVDALNNFGWWSGVITKVLTNKRYNVYFKHWNEEKEFDVSKLRLHVDWINGKWVQDSQEVSITSPSLGGSNFMDQQKSWQAGNGAQSIEMGLQHSSPRDKSPSFAANSSKNKTTDSTPNSEADLSQPCKKSKKGDATEPPFSQISCVTTRSAGTTPPTLVVSQSGIATPITEDEGIYHLRPLLFDDQPSDKASIPLHGKGGESPLSSFGQEKHIEVDSSTKSGRNNDLESGRSSGSRIRSSPKSCKTNPPPEIIDEQAKFVVSPETQSSRRGKQFLSQSQKQMKIISCGNEIKRRKVEVAGAEAGVLRKRGRPPKEKGIEPLKVKIVGKKPKVLRKRGRAAKEKFPNRNSLANGSKFLGKGGPQSEKVGQNLNGEHLELTRDESEFSDPVVHKKIVGNIRGSAQVKKGRSPRLPKQTITKEKSEKKEKLPAKRGRPKTPTSDLGTATKGPKHKASRRKMAENVSPIEYTPEIGMVFSDIADDEQPLSMFLRDFRTPPLMDDKGVMPVDRLICESIEAITWVDASNENLEHQNSFNQNEHSFNLEESTFIDDQCNEARGEQSEVVLNFKDNQCNGAREEQSETILQSPVIENGGLPFIKSSCMWKEIESLKVFFDLPQNPHFRPLEHYNRELREGMAIGYMVAFVNLAAKVGKLELDNPIVDFEDILKALLELESHGFIVEKVKDRLEELLRIKDKQVMLEDQSKRIQGKISEWNCESDKLSAEIDEINERLRELNKTIGQLNEKLASAVMKKEEISGSNITEFVKEMVEIDESVRSAKLDFQSVAASPW